MTDDIHKGFTIGDWRVEPLRGAISSTNGNERHLEPKVMDVFVYLAQHVNDVVTRDDLLDAVWKDHVAADELLTGTVSDLRQALKAADDGRAYIETVPKVGYRLVGDVTPSGDTTAPRSRLIPAALVVAGAVLALILVILAGAGGPFNRAALPPITSIAVVPFVNLSGNAELDYVSDGLSQALIVQLAKIDGLTVRSYQSVQRYRNSELDVREIASKLAVDAVLEGSALLVDDRVRMTVDLVDARADRQLWADSYDGAARDVLKIQGEIALEVARAVDIELSPQGRSLLRNAPSIDPEAYALFLRAGSLVSDLTEMSFTAAIDIYNRCIDLEPEFAPAYAGLARAYLGLASWHASGDKRELLPLAEAAADEALRLDGGFADTWFLRARIRRFEWDWMGAERAFRTGLEIDSNHVNGRIGYTNFLVTMGRFDDAVDIARPLPRLDPESPVAFNELAFALYQAGRIDEAFAVFDQSLDIDPDFFQTHGLLAEVHGKLGNVDKVLEHLRDAELGHPDLPPVALGINGRLYAFAGEPARARELLQRLLRLREQDATTSAVSIAEVYLGLGDLERAYEWLEAAFEERDLSLVWLNVDWFYLDARNRDPRIQALHDRMGFPDP